MATANPELSTLIEQFTHLAARMKALSENPPTPHRYYQEKVKERIAELVSHLDRPQTAARLSRKLKVSRPTVDRLLREAMLSGTKIRMEFGRQGKRGPLARWYTLEASDAH